MKSFVLFALIAFPINIVNARNSDTVLEKDVNGNIKSARFSSLDNNVPKSSDEFFMRVIGINKSDYFQLDKLKKSKYGMSFERYQQFYRGVKVEGGHYNFRYQNNKMKVVTGHLVDVSEINPIPDISEGEAIEIYMSHFLLSKAEVLNSIAKLIIKELPPKNDIDKNIATLVYQVSIETQQSNNLDIAYVDAHTGVILNTEKSTYDNSASGRFYTYYNREIGDRPKYGSTEYENGVYYLKDISRNIYTYKRDITVTELTDSDNIWQREELGDFNIALDVHWTFNQIYDILFMDFDYESYDGDNGAIYSVIRNGSYASYNKMWQYFDFGNGDDDLHPLGTVDVVSHEFGHAILHHTTGWNSSSELFKTLHEGFADIWGIFFESYITPNAELWKMGQDLYRNTYSCTRNIETPNDSTAEYQIADTYGVGLWNDEDAHVRSGVTSHWFYLLAQGGSGINGKGNAYSVLPVGLEQAKDLFVYTVLNTAYLEDCSSLIEVKEAFYDAAIDMGNNFLATQVENAWYAVGVGSSLNGIYGPDTICGNGIYNIYSIPSDYSVQWTFTGINGSISPAIMSNPSDNSCVVYTSSYFYGTLSAVIKRNSTIVGVFSKQISGDSSNFNATYWLNNTYGDILHEDDNWASPGDVISVHSDNFSGKTFKLSRSLSPNSFTTLSLNGNSLSFVMPNLNYNEYLILWITGSCGTYTYNFFSASNATNNSNQILQIEKLGGSQYLLSLKYPDNDTMSSNKTTEDNFIEDFNWEFQIYRVTDSRLITTQHSNTYNQILDTSFWKSGLYIIRATIKEKPYIFKFTIN